MPDLEQKLDIFREAVLNKSSAEAAGIRESLEVRHREDIKRIGYQLREQSDRYEQAKKSDISIREARRVSFHRNHNKHVLLQYREDCAKEVFAMARERVEEYVRSDEYPLHLAELLKKAIMQLGYGFEAEVYLRPEDMALEQTLTSAATGAMLSFYEGVFTLGGIRLVCPSRGLRIDMSFDSAFTDLIGHFSELSGMHLD